MDKVPQLGLPRFARRSTWTLDAMDSETAAIDAAIARLWDCRMFRHRDKALIIACLIRASDWRPLKASWWRGKEACIIGVDLGGNFLLRHCDGTVRYWDHEAQTDSVVAPSVRAFAKLLTWDHGV
jgi:hypothetical protein